MACIIGKKKLSTSKLYEMHYKLVHFKKGFQKALSDGQQKVLATVIREKRKKKTRL